MKVYIAGPMTGHADYNYPAFHKVAEEYRRMGFDVENPADHFDGRTDLPYHLYMRAALLSLLNCDLIVMLPGWSESYGATLEHRVATTVGIDVIDYAEGNILP